MQLTKVPVETCSQQTTCDECRNLADPYCGWCSLERRCSRRADCANSGQDKRWLSAKAWECIHIEWHSPQHASINSDQVQVSVMVLTWF